MLLALTRPSRSIDLSNLNIKFRYFNPEGVTFKPTKLAKQSRQAKPMTDFFFPLYGEDNKLCPVHTLKEYEKRTSQYRDSDDSQLFLALIKPYKPVSSSTIARWIKTFLADAGIDTTIFKAHSVRSASASAAAEAGVTTNDILKAADWSSQSVFEKFYYKPQHDNQFASAILSKQ